MSAFALRQRTDDPSASAVTLQSPADLLAYLPRSAITEYGKGECIYGHEIPQTSFHVVIAGKVKVCRQSPNGSPVVLDIYREDEFFGESVFLGSGPSPETATSLSRATIMGWSFGEIENLIERRPGFAMALMQLLVQRSDGFLGRIQSMAVENIPHRLCEALIGFAARLGNPGPDGTIQMIPLTHELLAAHVGTSREIVTQHMNHFRHAGFLQYTRTGIVLAPDGARAWMLKKAGLSRANELPATGGSTGTRP